MTIAIDRFLRALSRLRMCCGFAVLALAAFGVAHAETRCVATVAALTKAVSDAESAPEGSAWVINVHTGTYQLNGSLVFNPDGSHDNKDFVMIGGWSGSNGQCLTRTVDPSTTIIRNVTSTQQTPGGEFFFIGDNKSYVFKSIRFENFSRFIISDKFCLPYDICPDTYSVVVEHVEFNNAENILLTVTDAKNVVFRNNLVTNIAPIVDGGSSIDYAPVAFIIDNNEDAPQITFNTFADIHCLSTPGAVMIQTHQPAVALHHNIFQSTGCTDDIYIDPARNGKPVTSRSNLFLGIGGIYSGNFADPDQGNVQNFNPKFIDAFNGNYRLQNDSPAVNAGQSFIGATLRGLIVPTADLDAHARLTGLSYDIGAYESAVNDGAPPKITVTNTNDSGAGSLRDAITQANNSPGTPQRIVFDIPGGCPKAILLGTPLPLITDSLVIDGYSQPGSAKNDLDLGSDATVCIYIGPAANMGYAIQVDNAEPDPTQLTVSGLAFANSFYTFTGAPIELRSGGDHIVSGNVFGGYLPPGNNPNQIGSLTRAILVRGTATNVTIGGPDNADRNYFGFMSQNAIVLNDATSTGHTIQNNYIGVQPNGLAAQANSASGISASGGSDVTIVDNAICASDNGIELLGAATTNFTIQRNNIGVNAAGYGVAAHANNVGIEIALGSGQHVIGAPPGENLQTGVFSNYIDNNDSAGVLVASNAGNYNSIRGNLIEANGRSGSGLGIDLGAVGPLANDAGDPDTGPNLSENYPRIKGATPNGAKQTLQAVLNTNPNQAVRVDIYRSATCPGGAKGANATTLVGSVDVNSGATGMVSFNAPVTRFDPPGFLTATATTSIGNTSELAPCVREDTIFRDGHETPGL